MADWINKKAFIPRQVHTEVTTMDDGRVRCRALSGQVEVFGKTHEEAINSLNQAIYAKIGKQEI